MNSHYGITETFYEFLAKLSLLNNDKKCIKILFEDQLEIFNNDLLKENKETIIVPESFKFAFNNIKDTEYNYVNYFREAYKLNNDLADVYIYIFSNLVRKEEICTKYIKSILVK